MRTENDAAVAVVEAEQAQKPAQTLELAVCRADDELDLIDGGSENKPDKRRYKGLTTVVSFQQLQGRISALETGISDRRELYNESVNVNNATIEQFPASIIAGMFGFKPAKLLEFAAVEKADVDVKALFNA